MAAKDCDRLKPALENEGVAEVTNSKTPTDPAARTRTEISHNAPLSSPPHGEKRKASSASPDDGGQKKARPFAMFFGAKLRAGGEVASQKKDAASLKPGGTKGNSMKIAMIQPIRSVTMKLMQKPKEPELKAPISTAVAKAFTEDSDEEEEMPPEAKMRMKNVGRETPTSAGPNSYNKSKYGFNDHARSWKKDIDIKTGVNKSDDK